jgi:menaquinone-dependent protoporphyrinogen IX oxidase
VEDQATHLREEGHTIEMNKNNKPRKVKNFEKVLVEV